VINEDCDCEHEGTFRDEVTKDCHRCMEGCVGCDNASSCHDCDDGFYLNVYDICIKCHTNCHNCTIGTGECESCDGDLVPDGRECMCPAGQELVTGSTTRCVAPSAGECATN